MIIVFNYKCRRCLVVFDDASLPEMHANDVVQAEAILADSLRQNPTAKTRAAINMTHLCYPNIVGVGDLVGYRMYADPEPDQQQAPERDSSLRLLKFAEEHSKDE